MRKLLLYTVSLLLSLGLITKAAQAQTSVPRPALVVGIVVDQMRWDYLYRFQDRYTEGGFKRLMKEGYNCENTSIDYLPTFTAPGHTCIYTGSVPAFHGIVANDWIDNATGREWYCTEDTTVKSVGGGKAGLMSPKNMIANTVTDELRLATNFKSRVFGISIKDRGAILPAGHSANAAFWYDGSNGHFISSSYYLPQLPIWLQQFNSRNLFDSLMQLNWNTLYPINTYTQSTADDNAYEGKFKGESKPVFPHLTAQYADKGSIRSTPYGNTITRMMAEACIAGEQLGQQSGITDFLALSFSSTDYVGHLFGPNAIEIEDTYLRMDLEIQTLLQTLDNKVGKGKYLIFLTADHGGAHNATFLQDHKIPAKSLTIQKVNKDLNKFLEAEYGDSSLVNSLMNYQVYLNEPVLARKKINRDQLKKSVQTWLKNSEGVTQVVDLESGASALVPTGLMHTIANGYYAKRSGCLQIILDPAWYSGYASTGTTHGSWNPYDAHIPLLWYGWGIKKGHTFRAIKMTDIAATIAALLRIQAPNANIGQPILEIVD
jgi:predicted AlkP superfamily pyrophosphatase or phosphodiesterase